MKKLLWILLITLSFALYSYAAVIVNPSRFILVAEPGQRLTESITVVNTGTEPVSLTAVLYDWDLNEEGKLEEVPAGSMADSLESSLKFSPRQFTLNPGEAQTVRFTVQTPTDGTEHKGIVFFEEEITFAGEQAGANVTTKIGATIYVAPVDVSLAFEILNLAVTLVDGEVNLVLDGINRGTGHIRFEINYELQTKTGIVLKKDKYSEQVLLPGKTSRLLYPILKLESGDYRLVTQFEFTGFDKTHENAIDFTILGDNR